jgi:hypothetical protein
MLHRPTIKGDGGGDGRTSVKQHGTVKACFFSAAECESGSQKTCKQKTDQQSDQQNRPSVSIPTVTEQAKATEEATVDFSQQHGRVKTCIFSAVKCESGLQSRRHASRRQTKAAVEFSEVAWHGERTVAGCWEMNRLYRSAHSGSDLGFVSRRLVLQCVCSRSKWNGMTDSVRR